MSISAADGSNGGSYGDSYAIRIERARAAEKEANDRVLAAARKIKDAELEEQRALEQKKDEYEKLGEKESARQQGYLEELRNQGYEQIRELQRAQQADQRNVKIRGEEDLSELQGHYRQQVLDSHERGEKELHDMQVSQLKRMDFEKKSSDAQTRDFIENRDDQMKILREESQSKLDTLEVANRKQFEKTKQGYDEATERSNQNLQTKFDTISKANDESLARVTERANEKINQIRQDTATKLAAYANRQQDPFYSSIQINAEVNDAGAYYTVFVPVPQYERGHISAAVRGNALIVSGYRTANDEYDTPSTGPSETGKITTSSYQSFHQSFPFEWPISDKTLSRENLTDGVLFKIYKKQSNEHGPALEKVNQRVTESMKHDRPNFPKDLIEPIHITTKNEKVIFSGESGSGTLT